MDAGRRRKRSRVARAWLWCVAAGGVLLTLGAGQPPGQTTRQTAPPAEPAASPLDEPLRLIAEARRAYQGVRDYACLLVKRENVRGQLQPENLITMRVRTQPFSVYLRWHGPKTFAGQEACYVAGRNNGMMRVHSAGLLGAVGFVSIDPRDKRVSENSRHSITEAGIGNLIERFGKRYETDKRLGTATVRVAEYAYNKWRCMRVETIHADNGGGEIVFYRNVVYFDKELHLPIRAENYDWPRPGGDPGGELMEVYSYADLKLNVGLGDEVFNH
jgi:hypothetical protein